MGILPFFSTKQVPETAKRVKFSQLKHHMVGTRTGDEVNEGSPEEFREVPEVPQTQVAVPELNSLVVVEPMSSELGSHQQCSQLCV